MELLEKVWPEWKIEGVLGEGSFGKVYKIKREDIGGTYYAALKVISIPKDKSEINSIMTEGMMDMASATHYFQGMVEEIVKEFAMMEKLKGNTNIVAYEDHKVIPREDSIGWDILIRMELLSPLTDYMAEHTLGEQDAIRLGIDICRALELCQKYNIIHRDIKPENIFVSEIGDYKLGDFGVARTAEKTTSGMSKKGTYTYMAPEVYKGEAYNATVDLYSLGIVLYRLVNNYRTPFLPPAPQMISFSDKENAQVRRMNGEELPVPAQGSEAFTAVIRKACAFHPKERFADAAQMRMALEELQKGAAVTGDAAGSTAVAGDKTAAGAVTGDKGMESTVSLFSNAMTDMQEEKTVSMAMNAMQEDKTVSMQSFQQATQSEQIAPKTAKTGKKTGLFVGIGVAAGALIACLVLVFLHPFDKSGENKDESGAKNVAQGNKDKEDDGEDDEDDEKKADKDNDKDIDEDKDEDKDKEKDEDKKPSIRYEDMNILATKLTLDADGRLCIPEGAEAMAHNNRVYHPISMLGDWVPETDAYSISDSSNFHPASDSRIVLGEGENFVELECLPISFELTPYDPDYDAMFGNLDIMNANVGGMYCLEGKFMENPSEENRIGHAMEIKGYFDTHEDVLAMGFEVALESETVSRMQEIHYTISWAGYRLTLTYGDYSMTYVPAAFRDERWSLTEEGGCIPMCTPIDGLGEKIYYQAGPNAGDKFKTSYYTPEYFMQDGTAKYNTDGTITIDTVEMQSNNYKYPAKHLELKYRVSKYAMTLISEENTAVYSFYHDSGKQYYKELSGEVTNDTVTTEQIVQIVDNKNTLLQRLKEAFAEAGIEVDIDESTGKVNLDSSILFGFDDATLSQEGKDFLDRFLGVYASVILSEECAGFVSGIEIEGHTDTSGKYDYNLKLSKERADSVADYCLRESNSGLTADQLATFAAMTTTVGRSYDDPVYNRDGTVNMDASRRVVFRFRLSVE